MADKPVTLRVKERPLGLTPKDGNMGGMYRWEVVLKRDRQVYQCLFHMGPGHVTKRRSPRGASEEPTAPTAASVLCCLVSDAMGVEGRTFEEWASDYGYDTDSRRAEFTYNACVMVNNRIWTFLGEDLTTLIRKSDDQEGTINEIADTEVPR